MKFAKELERDLVPEWRLKYLDYKLGKKKLKAIRRALRTVNQTPRIRRRGTAAFTPSPFDSAPKYSFLNRNYGKHTDTSRDPEDLRHIAIGNSQSSLKGKTNGRRPSAKKDEEAPLNGAEDPRYPGLTRYGSIIRTPHSDAKSPGRGDRPPSLKLPGAALDPENHSPRLSPARSPTKQTVTPPSHGDVAGENAFEVGKTRSPPASKSLPARYKSIFTPKRMNSSPGGPIAPTPPPLLKRVFSMSHGPPPPSPGDVPLEAYRELDLRQAEFFHFLDMELDKVEAFYKQKEEEATERLAVLREQLHVMADRRLSHLIDRHTAKIKARADKHGDANKSLMNGHDNGSDDEDANGHDQATGHNSWLIDSALEAVQAGKYGKSTKAMQGLATPSALRPQRPEDRHDYERRPEQPQVSYQTAKRKLKVALQEYYRGLELLKSYALLNRTAFRKINKKFDKAVNARPSLRYVSEKVNSAWFVNSDVIEGHIRAVEDLYARYFEKGNHKVAVNKLRIKIARAGDYTENSFRNGLMLGLGAVFGVQGLVKGVQLLDSENIVLGRNTSYLLQACDSSSDQIYAGYFLMNFLFLLFCLDCRVWHYHKINYVFVFEYDTRHFLDWRQLFELPCFFLFLLGFFVWLNFSQYGGPSLFLYYPVILLGLTTILLFNPIKILYFRSRMWLLFSMWRLVCAGFYPVEWRDFYMGDMFCSLTYSTGNIELFFCLYANDWNFPGQCNSSSSRLLGFFTTLPGIWRAVQCFRRYYDTGNAFPHLLNLGKYTATVIFYMVLSIYRIDKSGTNRALFITFAIINSIYCSFWDVYYDWSLGDPNAKHRFLRQTLGYKRTWWYYGAMIIDPILRFNWILYAIIPLQLQHSAVTSFGVSFSEVCRRGMWSLFRVENEHCSNVGHFRASRDVPLPYSIAPTEPPTRRPSTDERQHARPGTDEEQPPPHTTATDFAPAPSHTSIRHRRSASESRVSRPSPIARGLTRMGTILRQAHAQDFQKKKKPELGAATEGGKDDDSDDSDVEEPEDRSEGHSVGESAEPLLRGEGKRRDINTALGDGGGGGVREREREAGNEVMREAEVQSEREIQEVRDDVEVGRGGPSRLV
ncbi:EXS-domain-containing protein [Byssothecium circinans]|uniref:EXS-domain-containing protein n=1 Tax=Byssothecium circinans TaxID=147558 RepID=A0A6A5UEM2_9PLEO|nr:EXS-domain-containing protein [Byssothecium circinans]